MADECIVGEAAIVSIVVFNGDEMVGGKLFKSLLCLDSFITGGACHHVYITEAREVVDKDSGCFLVLSGQLAFDLGDKTWPC